MAAKDYTRVMPGIRSKLVYCDESIVVVETLLEKGARVPSHSHEGMQLSICLEGRMELRLGDGRTVVMEPGSYLVIPAGLEHEATALEDTRILDINAPFTEDRKSLVEKLGGCKTK